MKKLVLLTLVLVLTLQAWAQTSAIVPAPNKQTVVYNRSYRLSQANDTTNYFYIGTGLNGLGVAIWMPDSANLKISYKLRSSVTGATTGFVVLEDSVKAAAYDGERLSPIVSDSLIGFDQVRFLIEYRAAPPATGPANTNEASRYYKLYLCPSKPSESAFGLRDGTTPYLYSKAPYEIYSLAYTASTTNDTTKKFPILSGSALTVMAGASDSAEVTVYYRLWNTECTDTSAWTALNSKVGINQSGAAAPNTYSARRVGTLAASTLLGWTHIEYYIDYLSGSTSEASRTFKLYHYLLKD